MIPVISRNSERAKNDAQVRENVNSIRSTNIDEKTRA
jgi:hypothetical protein